MLGGHSFNGLRGTLALFTVLPVARGLGWQGKAMLPWFPAAGLLIGCIWATFDVLTGHAFPTPLRAGIDVLFLVLLTGGLHLDGLADTADGMLSHRGRERALEIMKDSHTGTWGVLALVAVLGLKTLALWHVLLVHGSFTLVLVPAYGRTTMLAGFEALPYGRPEAGIASDLFESGQWRRFIPGTLLVLAASLGLGWPAMVVVNLCFVAVTALVLLWYRRLMGCITGDMLGAMVEITETVLLVVLAAG